MADHGWITITHWDRFQHYRGRNPPWIKNYRALLHDDNYLRLSSADRGVLHSLWLAYAESDMELTADPRLLARRLNIRRVDLTPLIRAGFITISPTRGTPPEGLTFTRESVDIQLSVIPKSFENHLTVIPDPTEPPNHAPSRPQTASNLLAKCSQNASTETETETEEGQLETPIPDPGRIDHQNQETHQPLPPAITTAIHRLCDDLPDATHGTLGRLVNLAKAGATEADIHDARQGWRAATNVGSPARYACQIVADHVRERATERAR